MTGRATLAVVVLAVLAAGCAVGTAPATVAGPGPDTSSAALAERDRTDEATSGRIASSTPGTPSLDEVTPPSATPPVLLRGQDGPRWVERPAGTTAGGDPIVDAVDLLARPLTDDEVAAGLVTSVPPGTSVVTYTEPGPWMVVELDGPYLGGTDATLTELGQQVACTLHLVLGSTPDDTVEVVVRGTSIVTWRWGSCP